MRRSPMQVDEEFHKKMKKIQEEIMKKQGKFKGFRKIQQEMIKMPEWEIMEKKLLGDVQQIGLKINFDRRKRQ